MKSKVLLLVPHYKLPGGVGNYYSEAKKYFSQDFRCVYYNSKYEKGLLKKLLNPITILLSCFRILFARPGKVVVNPSLKNLAIKRDGIFVLWANFLRLDTVVFWRGWNPENEALFESNLNRFFLKKGFLRAEKHLVLNEYVKSKLISYGVDRDQIFLQATLVDDQYFEQSKDNGKAKNDKIVVLFLTRIEKYKGIYEALEMIEQLPKEDIDFHIAGDGSELENVKAYISRKKLYNVHVLGFLSGKAKMNAFISSDIYLFPSYSEGMPNSLLEAMGAGLPIVCTNVGAIQDFFEDGQMGYSHDLPIQTEEFVKDLLHLIQSKKKRRNFGEHNRLYAERHFKASVVIKNLEKTILS